MKTQNPIKVGSYVKDNIHGYTGRVSTIHSFVDLPEDNYWVVIQVPPIEDEALEPSYLWYSVLVHEGGSILRPAYALDEIEPFDLSNPWVDRHFSDKV